MSEKAGGGRLKPKSARVARLASRWTLPAVLAFVFVAALIAGAAVSPYLFQATTLEREIALQLRATTGLELSAKMTGVFELLPRPHVLLDAPRVSDPDGHITLSADSLDGDVRLLPLIVGRVELSSATLVRPHIDIDLEWGPMSAGSLLGRAMRATGPIEPADRQRLGAVTLVDGTATLKGPSPSRARNLTGIDVTLDWRDLDSPATLTGALSVDGMATDVAAWIAEPSALLRGDHSAVAFHVHSAPIDLSASGDLVRNGATTFRGHLSSTVPSVPAILDRIGVDTTLLAPFANVMLVSDANVAVDAQGQPTIDLSSLKLRADGNDYEGTLAFQGGGRPTLSGTLATEQLALPPFLSKMPALFDAARAWSKAPIMGGVPRPLDLDLRISATRARLPPVTIDDAAVAIITRGRRTEIALVEGKAYGGAAKGRVSIGLSEDGIDLRGAGSLVGADASALAWDALGRQVATGTLNGSADLETSGDSPSALIHGLQGWAKGTLTDGEISGIDAASALRDIGRKRPEAALAALRGGRTAFASLTLGTRIGDGIATIVDGTMSGPDALIKLEGDADLDARTLDVRCQADAPSGGVVAPHLPFGIEGFFDKPTLVPIEAPQSQSDPSTPETKAPPR